MKLSNDDRYITVTFEQEDWYENFAREVMDLMKSYGQGMAVYLGVTKKWRVLVSTGFLEDLEALIKSRNKDRVDPMEYDVDEFLSQFN